MLQVAGFAFRRVVTKAEQVADAQVQLGLVDGLGEELLGLRLKASGDLLRNHGEQLENDVEARIADLGRFRKAMNATDDAIFLLNRHCDQTQGYHFSRPLTATQLEAMLEKTLSAA